MENLVSVKDSIASGCDVAKSRASSCPGRVTGRTWRNAGFSLVELMIVVAIIAILSAIAFPTYTSYIAKSHRVAAEGCLSEYSNYMERYYTTWLNYSQDGSGNANALPAFDCASTAQTGTNYSYLLPTLTATTYTVEAVPTGTQVTSDAKCGTLELDQTGARYAFGPSGPSVCWQH